MRYAAFLRAINVGKHNRIRMADLIGVCTNAGLTDLSTYLQTGNLTFDFDGDEAEAASTIEGALTAHGLRGASAVVRTSPELEELLAANPFAPYPTESYTRFVTLFRSPLPTEAQSMARDIANVVLVRDREVCSVLPIPRTAALDINGLLSKKAKVEGTTRYWHVVEEVRRLLG